MIRVPGWTGLIALLIGLGGCAASVPHEIDAASIRPLIEFVERETGVKLDPMPSIVSLPAVHLAARRDGDLGADRRPLAVYNTVKIRDGSGYHIMGVIRINADRFSRNAEQDNATMVHELVHHAQTIAVVNAYLSGGDHAVLTLIRERGWECARSMEKDAYRIENRWLYARAPQHSVPQSHIEAMSSCRDGDLGVIERINASPYADDLAALSAQNRLK